MIERLKAEKAELDGKLCMLLLFTQHSPTFKDLSKREQELLTLQGYWMQCYSAVLEERLKLKENQ